MSIHVQFRLKDPPCFSHPKKGSLWITCPCCVVVKLGKPHSEMEQVEHVAYMIVHNLFPYFPLKLKESVLFSTGFLSMILRLWL